MITEAERATWQPPACPLCGASRTFSGDWAEVSTLGDREPLYAPAGFFVCPTPRCGRACRTCRREPGDVHGPHCGDLMFRKVVRPHIVDASDCR